MYAKFFVGKLVSGITNPIINLLNKLNKKLFIMQTLNELNTELAQQLNKAKAENETVINDLHKYIRMFNNFRSVTNEALSSSLDFIESKGLVEEYHSYHSKRVQEHVEDGVQGC